MHKSDRRRPMYVDITRKENLCQGSCNAIVRRAAFYVELYVQMLKTAPSCSDKESFKISWIQIIPTIVPCTCIITARLS